MTDPLLSPTMSACIELAKLNGGELVRYPGGFWAPRGATLDERGTPRHYHGTRTVEAVVNRGAASYSEWKDGRSGRFPVVMKIKESRA